MGKRHRGAIVKRDLLRPHNEGLNVRDKIGERKEITESSSAEDRSAWYCADCKCQLKDSHTYLDHINGKKHQRVLGMSMRVEDSTLQQVRNRLEMHKKRSRDDFEQEMDVTERIEQRKAKEQRVRELKKQAKKRRKLARKQSEKDREYGAQRQKQTHRIKEKERDRDRNEKKKAVVETEYVPDEDPEMAAMGFTFSFGGSKK